MGRFLLAYMARKYPLITQMYSLPPPRSAMIEGSAVDVMVASSAVSRPAKPIATMMAQNLRPGLNWLAAAGGGLTDDASCMISLGSKRDFEVLTFVDIEKLYKIVECMPLDVRVLSCWQEALVQLGDLLIIFNLDR